MLIGKQGKTASVICTGAAPGATIRGRILCGEPTGLVSFTACFDLLVAAGMPHEADPA